MIPVVEHQGANQPDARPGHDFLAAIEHGPGRRGSLRRESLNQGSRGLYAFVERREQLGAVLGFRLGERANVEGVDREDLRQGSWYLRRMQGELAQRIRLLVRFPGEFLFGNPLQNAPRGLRLRIELHQQRVGHGIHRCHSGFR